MNIVFSTKKTSFSVGIIILFIPFLFFYWMIPFVSGNTIGSDYLAFPIKNQMELLFSLKSGSFPLYIPGFASGHSSSALTLGQMFHPLPHIASMMPGYWNGKVIDWNNFLKLFSLGFTHLALFAFLRKIRLSILFSFLLSLITVYNLRIADLFRYGAPLEAYTAHLLLCAAIGWYYINPTRWLGPLSVIGATYLLVCSGHPQMMYFGLVGAGLFILIVPFFLSDMLYDEQVDYKIALKFWLKTGCFLCLGIMLSSAYILPFYFDFITMNISRVGQNYAWANENLYSFISTVNNFILPLRSGTQSAFGGSLLIFMAVIVPVLLCFKIKLPRSIWACWCLLLIMFLYMQGSRTPLHRFIWEYFPFASSFRTAGRISMIMPIFMMMILAWVVGKEGSPRIYSPSSFKLRPLTILSSASLLLIITYYLMYIAGYYMFSLSILRSPSSVGNFLNIPFFWVELIILISGIASLILLVIYSLRTGAAGMIGILLIIVMFVQLGIVLKYRTGFWIEKKYVSPTFEEMQKQKKTGLDYLYYSGGGLHSSIVIKQLERSFMEPFLGKIFTEVIPVKDMSGAFNKMEHERLPQQVFIEGYDNGKAKAITEGAKDMKAGRVVLTYSSFNRLEFKVDSEANALFGLSYPYTGHWSAWVNGEEAQVYRANGTAHAIEIPEGESRIEFRYWSAAYFWGVAVSSMVFAVIGLFVCFRGLKGLPRIAGIVIVLIISAGGFMLWYNSLYSGDDLETEYIWTYASPLKNPNLAYGKKNWLSASVTSDQWIYDIARWHMTQQDLYVNKFVDGNRKADSGFLARLSETPGWFLDMGRKERIETIILFESSRDASVNVRPIIVGFSDNGDTWRTVASVDSPVNGNGPIRISLDKIQTARYIKIEASGKSKLSFDEVEVYGPLSSHLP